MADFTLDDRLAADTSAVFELALSSVYVFNDCRYPWLVLVPRRADCVELIDLTGAEQLTLMREIAAASEVLRDLHAPHKLNVAALGNHVRQLHVHVIARQTADAAWPNPVWGVGTAKPYDKPTLSAETARLRTAFAATTH